MAKDSPKKKQPQPGPTKDRQPPITIKKDSLPPDAVKRAKKFYEDSREIERGLWRSIYG